ncbi:low temperature requirement protein A [Schumannella sp. 10F1B-5-1]|uniref:low temperature requirement protein A n=1 Tax=Schumannella sp. 10F1B-5-1 TaxID=2590780 RepID=UPI0011327163|nr:low temperature requirement protein A [Schumannella sp. 10F1B-5-1]TPW72316.1 low temperature requirement protein A [Schumannella sp. 10F1B-5-1]
MSLDRETRPLPGVAGRMRRMLGRDPHESERAATPLELLFDLAFVVAFGIAGEQMAHALAEGHLSTALGGFGFGMFAIVWAWINFSWFASAFDTDDWVYRLTTMVQMVGVVILALGLSDVFHSLDEGHSVDNTVVVAGYIVMRVAMVAQWLRLAAQSPEHRGTALTYAVAIAIAQVGWIALAALHLELTPTLIGMIVLYLVELAGPVISERRASTPWHPHHIAERYGLLALIALGEGVLGTVAAVQPIIEEQGWSGDAIVLVTAGVVLTFGLWWAYFAVPFGDLLHRKRSGAFAFGYLHIIVFAAIAAVGAGLHVGAYVIEGEAHVGYGAAVRAVAIPVAIFLIGYLAIADILTRRVSPAQLGMLALAVGVLVLAVALSETGTPFALDILLVAAAPWIVVIGSETFGRRHLERHLAAS